MTLRRGLLICGVAASLLYIGIDQLAAVRHADYHAFVSQTISELGARGAPTKPLVDPLFIVYDLLTIAFGVGVWMSAGSKRALRVAAAALIVLGAGGLPGPWLFPMNLRGVGGDLPHIVATAAMVLCIVVAVAFAAFALGQRFRNYSFATLGAALAFGAVTSVQARGLITGAPTPWIGLTERICIGVFLAWAVVLAIALLRAPPGTTARQARSGGRAVQATARSAHA
jgi:hypothetical protein